MSVSTTPFSTSDLERLLRRVEPAALLVWPRILRRVIKKDRGIGGIGLQVPHRKSYVIERERLLGIADREELGLPADRELPATLLLVPLPSSQELADPNATLLKYWRLLFHARIHQILAQQRKDGQLTEKEVHTRLQQIGSTEFAEATAVLRQDHYLLPPQDLCSLYEEFVAVYLELRYFRPSLLPIYFPTIPPGAALEGIVGKGIDADDLFARTRPEGAPEPGKGQSEEVGTEISNKEQGISNIEGQTSEEGLPLTPRFSPFAHPDERAYRTLLARADAAGAKGNVVRAAIFRMRAVPLAPAREADATRVLAVQAVEQLLARLQASLGFGAAEAGDWRQALLALLEPATHGIWPSEGRMLYDLQKVCVDRERPIYAVDLVEWFASWGRRPIKRLLPFHGQVLMVKHLRAARHRLTVINIPESIRRRLITLLVQAVHRSEEQLRERLRPTVRQTLVDVGLAPRNITEEVACDKVVEELLDQIIERGFLGIGDLRDAIARNRLKLADLTDKETNHRVTENTEKNTETERTPSPFMSSSVSSSVFSVTLWLAQLKAAGRGIRAFFVGDPLIRINRRLSADLDGIYHRAEIYLRWLQRISAAAFGTHIGRLLTLYVVLPFGCSLALLKMWDHLVELFAGGPEEGSEAAVQAAKHINPYAFTLLGFFFLALIHVGPFRRGLELLLRWVWDGLRFLFFDLPAAFLHLPWVLRIVQSRLYLALYQYLLKPLPWGLVCALLLSRRGASLSLTLEMGTVVFVVAGLFINSRLGMVAEEISTDSLIRTWHLFRTDVVPGLVRSVIYVFRRLQEEVERLIYTVDEWLRFRPGDSRLSLFVKPVLGLLWFGCTYVFRLVFNLFVEPTFNPIKHVPVVTVTAKLIVPVYADLFRLFKGPLEPLLGKALARMGAGTSIFLLPGLAGFLVWELKENWRLYKANQSPVLQPEIVGHHGETMLRLMRPGLHSGTLPKLYARLRRRRGLAIRRQYEALAHLKERLRQFVERNLLAVLAGSKSWGDDTPLTVGSINVGTNRIRIELCSSTCGVHVDFEEHAGWLVAGLSRQSATPRWGQTWLARLRPEQALAFRDALAGFYKLAGVDLVREQLANDLPTGLDTIPNLPVLRTNEVLFSAMPIHWCDWVQTWQIDHDGKGHAPLLPEQVRLLPAPEETYGPFA
jgi:hypothetical protein